ncbi:hypothetical protein FBU59_005291, partial [Linderina macrospora]
MLEGMRFAIQEVLYILPVRTRIQANILKGMARAKVSEYWKGSMYRFISITRSSERAIPVGIPRAVEMNVISLASVVASTIAMLHVSPMGTAVFVCVGGMVVYRRIPKSGILQPLGAAGFQMKQEQDRLLEEAVSGSLMVRTFEAFGYFEDHIGRYSILEQQAKQAADAVVDFQSLIQAIGEHSAMYFLVAGMLWRSVVEKSVRLGAGDIQYQYLTLKMAMPIVSSLAGIKNAFINNVYPLQEVYDKAHMEAEAPEHVEGSSLAADWPAHGQIEFRNYSMRFTAQQDRALVDISFQIRAGEK